MSNSDDDFIDIFMSIIFGAAVVGALFLVGIFIYTAFFSPPMEEVSVCTQTSETEQVCQDEWIYVEEK